MLRLKIKKYNNNRVLKITSGSSFSGNALLQGFLKVSQHLLHQVNVDCPNFSSNFSSGFIDVDFSLQVSHKNYSQVNRSGVRVDQYITETGVKCSGKMQRTICIEILALGAVAPFCWNMSSVNSFIHSS